MPRAKKAALPWSQISSAAFGAAVGGVLGMLFSPNSGKKNRQLVVKEGKKVASVATRAAKQVKKEIVKTSLVLEKKVAPKKKAVVPRKTK